MTKYICDECEWKGKDEDLLRAPLLRAPNPFSEDGDTMFGCPQCREPNTMIVACDEVGCWEQVSCGTPTPTGYRSTCYRHKPLFSGVRNDG